MAEAHTYLVRAEGSDAELVWMHNAYDAGIESRNTNDAEGNFGVYEIEVNDELYKVGKADLDRVTASSQLPTRLHQQLRILRIKYRENAVVGRVLPGNYSTTGLAKIAEVGQLQSYYNATESIPFGNLKSFKPL